jgi:FeS assembly SUF system protein
MTSGNETSRDELRDRVVRSLRKVHDPEIPVNIYDLGLIYELGVDDEGRVGIVMTLTAPNCPVADQIVDDVRKAAAETEGVAGADVKLVFEPAWSTEKMSDVARLELQAMGVDPDRAKQSLASRPTGLTVDRRPGQGR